ncbi:hypothetical protein Pmani_016097 [Petrolisthes manimaculis]|uniref:Uncharacterized protein n=1 Tax=Petrolisthes manimaculis TaxID=1843537 RepID=A0AAE1PSE8_9EUCA|nr:hypothetical protein Pmani_016097 [Petrolisthes manimaculis]
MGYGTRNETSLEYRLDDQTTTLRPTVTGGGATGTRGGVTGTTGGVVTGTKGGVTGTIGGEATGITGVPGNRRKYYRKGNMKRSTRGGVTLGKQKE